MSFFRRILSRTPELKHEATQKVSLRQVGELERKYSKAQLPPTFITQEALRVFQEWGLEREQVRLLQEYTAQFRYDLCTERLKRISENKIELQYVAGQEKIIFQGFFDTEGRFDGQCGDLAYQWIIQIHKSGLLDTLNAQSRSNQEIVPGLCTGLSRTHFNIEGSNHVWNALTTISQNSTPQNVIHIDPSFQTISLAQESGYQRKSLVVNPMSFSLNKNYGLPVGIIGEQNGQWSADNVEEAVLGISSEGFYTYGFCIAREDISHELWAILAITNPSGDALYIAQTPDKILLPDLSEYSPTVIQEIHELFAILKNIQNKQFSRNSTINLQEKMLWEKHGST